MDNSNLDAQKMLDQQLELAADSSLLELLRDIWARKLMVIGAMVVGISVASVIAVLLPNIYKAEALLAPNEGSGARSFGGLAGQYGGLASLAGIDLSVSSVDKTELAIELLRSKKFFADFAKRHDILVQLFAVKKWERSSGNLLLDPKMYDDSCQCWVRDVDPPFQPEPSTQEAYEEFRDILKVHEDKRTGFVTVSIRHKSPIVAKRWVDWLVSDINMTARERDVRQAEQAVEYLNKQVQATSIAGLQSVFFSLIEEQMKTIMLANVSEEYLFETIDPAVAPELKHSPQRALIVFMGALLGAVIGVLLALLLGSVERRSAGIKAA